MEERVDAVVDTDKRGEIEDKLVADLKATNLIEILANYYGKDEGICADMIKASVNHGADYLNKALADFLAKA